MGEAGRARGSVQAVAAPGIAAAEALGEQGEDRSGGESGSRRASQSPGRRADGWENGGKMSVPAREKGRAPSPVPASHWVIAKIPPTTKGLSVGFSG